MDTSIARQKLTLNALKLLGRFEQLNIKALGIDDKYRQLFVKFRKDIENTKEVASNCLHL